MKKHIFIGICVLAILAAMPVMALEQPVAQIIGASGICIDKSGNCLVADAYNKVIWQLKDGAYTQLAGRTAPRGASDVPIGEYIDAELGKASFVSPWGISPFLDGYAVTDCDCNTVRYISDKDVQTIAGSKAAGYKDSVGINARFARPTGIATDDSGCLYICDTDNNLIRKISTKGEVTTYAGSTEGSADGTLRKASFRQPTGIAFANGALYVADTGNHCIRMIKNGEVTTLAGKPLAEGTDEFYEGGFVDGDAKTAMFAAPQGIAVKGDNVYVADTMNGAIRLISDGKVSTIFQNENTAENLYPTMPRAIAIADGKLIVGDVFAKTVFTVDISPVATAPSTVASAPTSKAQSAPTIQSAPPVQNNSGFPLWILIVIIAAAISIATIVIVAVLKKKKENK
ncbi:MAG: hypothetical protein RR349_07165 [Oscillospiraceae bacterium]